MNKKNFLIQALQAGNRGTGMQQFARSLIQCASTGYQKIRALYLAFESSKIKWPPMSRDGSIKPACKKGCAYCCHLNVDVLKLEMVYIWTNLQKVRTPEELEVIKQKAQVNYDIKHKLSYDERMSSRLKCPFLGDDNFCTIYEDRPLSCRGMYSGDLQSCIVRMTQDTQNTFWAAPYLIADDMITGASLGLLLSIDGNDAMNKVTTQLETAILQQYDENVKDYMLWKE